MKSWERIADDLHRAGYSYGYSKAIVAFVGDVWVVDASRGGERWIVRAATLIEAFVELREQCEIVIQTDSEDAFGR